MKTEQSIGCLALVGRRNAKFSLLGVEFCFGVMTRCFVDSVT